MDPDPEIRMNATVRTALVTGDVGQIVRAVRNANNLTLKDLADRCGYSIASVSRMERGKQPMRDVTMLRRFAEALRIPPTLLGLADTPSRSVPFPPRAARVRSILALDEGTDPMRRRTLLAGLTGLAGAAVLNAEARASAGIEPIKALENTLLNPSTPTGVPTTLTQLRQYAACARSVFQHGHYLDAVGHMPALLAAAAATRADVAGDEDTAAADGQLAEVYSLATQLLVKLGHDHLAWVAADRALQAAYSSGEVLTMATARRTQGVVLRRAGQADTAQQFMVDTAAALQPGLHQGPEHLSVYGSLLATAAYTAAVDGNGANANALINEALNTADRFASDANHRYTAFGPTGVRLYQITIARVLGDPGTAIDVARQVNPATIPVAERRARYWSDVARSFDQWNKPAHTYRALLAAERAAPDEVRHRKPVQQITTNLLTHPKARTLPGLHKFARRVGIAG
ncbi:helix-turn-helix domain-containing protein [Actinophytocola sp.]|uniref:helix-turn-helix domain-containing protein n=1 Tax=Actinophytocola sp. TaxID=1872138 RepID=UPI0025C014C0|nr:helix-turn-helix domain-containing protein [Actinophytocola sp.]